MRKVKRGTLNPGQSSLVLDIRPAILSRGITHPTAFLQKLGINPNSVSKLLKGEACQINLIQLTKICTALRCEPNHLFARRDLHLDKDHPLMNLPQHRPVPDMMSVEEFLSKKSVEEVRRLLGR
ncbi:helix-turn-helix domain-containing protein [Flavobacterium pallidum]|uniref:HTH cro/C1-type domain-containing protein n=1 Tax=Flavobacterium pallidum TaxID=2172098 RepID=A0A2S1SE00_9FLAO|nr:helix-turn-helix transcriptional regulator [Flavobacterium pallidum]AWI24628.1 hypothetical protein HYN49_01270 [Flavobacterium pallidum]